ncbi:MAG: hypothetical protein BWZ02_01870 [Lentisphaerae bacterium ADurb.BinA184]|nr:MAG: hypothetical protein BWZ02_01870 [Lentisphaerae bacterium ADurb.BinA184]
MTTRTLTAAFSLLTALAAVATETENLGIRILPAPGKVVVDADSADWDVSGGVFVCGDVENLRGRLACWFHAMYDVDNLYVLTRWIDDTPMNNPGSVSGDHGFAGDCLQFRTLVYLDQPQIGGRPESPAQRTTHVTAWRDRDGKDVIDLAWGIYFDQDGLKDAKTQGGAQAFAPHADGKGYTQEIALPWKLLAPPGWAPAAGRKIILTVEPNFGTETKFRISLKDIFRRGVTPDRVFTFSGPTCWGYGTLSEKGGVEPQPLRLADNREFDVTLQDGVPAIVWSGLYRQKTMEGFAGLKFTMPDDGYVSLNIRNADGQVIRQLLNANFFTRGEHEVKWDGLTNLSHLQPGDVVPVGDYTWEAIWHKGLGLRLVGWACNSGRAPFDSPGGNWGGDMGNPCAVACDGERLILGWSGSEAGKAVVCTDFDGNVQWRHKRGGFGMARQVAAAGGVVFVYDRQSGGNQVYRLDAGKGDYTPWKDSTEAILDVTALLKPFLPANLESVPKEEAEAPSLTGMDAAGGKLFLSYGVGGRVLILDASTGKLEKAVAVERPGDLEVGVDGKCYVLSGGTRLVRFDPGAGTTEPVVTDLRNAAAVACDAAGQLYIGVGEPDNQVKVFGPDGKPLRVIGKLGGRPPLGKWDASGMRAISGLRTDPQGKLWVMENDDTPRRISVWNAAGGEFIREFFGPTNYGAGGGAISPLDPYCMVGHGSEWKLDPATGRASCVAVFHRGGMANARFGLGPGGRLYLAVGGGWAPNYAVRIYERVAAGEWALRTKLMPLDKDGQPHDQVDQGGNRGLAVWADANGDQQEQPEEVRAFPMDLGGWIDGWYMPMTQSLVFYGGTLRIAPTGWTACGAPVYDLAQAKRMPAPADVGQRGGMGAQRGCGSEDGRLALYNGHYGANHSDFQCWDIETGKLRWTYPNNYVGVHGGHNAPPPQTGMIRGAYDVVGSVRLPDPVGDLFVIPTDKGEWHLLTGEGFYLSALFQADPLKIQFPDPAAPGAIMDNTPPGMGAEDFGGSITATRDGQLHIQAGKTAFTNLKVVGLDGVKRLAAGAVKVSPADVRTAAGLREKLLQQAVGTRSVTASKKTVVFTGDLRKDFGREDLPAWSRNDAGAEAAVAWDETFLYLGWSVADATPWVNGATEPAVMYASGDTADFQMGTDPKADRRRDKPVAGDLRLSIGNFQGKPTAVLYRPLAADKAPRKFYSGTVKDGYEMESVRVVAEARIEVTVDAPGRRYVVEAAVPLAALGVAPSPGLTFSGDFGVTYGDPDGKDTVLRSYWNNQATGIVADEVWELVLAPANWGQIVVE